MPTIHALPRAPRVLYCTDTYPPQVNGVSVVTALSVAGLRARGWEAVVVAPRYPTKLPDPFTQNGDRSQRERIIGVANVPLPIYPDIRLAAPDIRTVVNEVRRFRPDLVHSATEFVLGRVGQWAATRAGIPAVSSGGQAHGSYTYNRARDNSTFSCCIARTASLLTPIKSDPRDLSGSWGPSDYDFRHKITAYADVPVGWGMALGARYVGASGRPFSVTVNGDINGDDYSGNDLAFVFDPDDPSTPPDIAAAMRRLLANKNSVARDYIRNNLGRIADRNAGSAPWTHRVDVRAAKRFTTVGRQGVELVVDVYNFANMLNSKWGGQFLLPQGISASNPTTQQLHLLNVVGFDQTTRRYRYTVNENVGVLRKRGDPYQIQIGVRYGF